MKTHTLNSRRLLTTISIFVAAILNARGATPLVLNTNDSGPGSLRQIVAYASSGATITFTNTLSGQTILLTNGQLLVDKNLTIDASSLPGGIAINGNHNSRLFEFASGTTNTLIGLTLTNGRASGSYFTNRIGGAILLNDGAGLTLVDCTASDNSAQSAGGGIFSSGMLTLNHTTLRGNSGGGGGGGGIYTMRGTFGGTLTLTNSTVSDNSARWGGGIYNTNINLITISASTLSGNSATNSGGGIYNVLGMLALNNSTLFTNTTATSLGTENGGGIYTYLGPLALNNCTLFGNLAGVGGGIYSQGTFPTLINSIVAGNTAVSDDNIHGSFTGANNLTADDLDPMLAPLGYYGGPTQTMPPLPGSPAIDGGLDTGSLPVTDQRGYPRVVNGTVDIGAVEFQGASDATLAVNPTSLSPECVQGDDALSDTFEVWNSGGGTLGYTITYTNSWLSCTPASGIITGETNVITVSYDTDSLAPDTYHGTITVTAPDAAGSPQTLAVTLTVEPSEGTLAWWRFEAGPDGTDVEHTNPVGAFSPDVPDSSGNGNHLSAWSTGGESGCGYRSDVAAGQIPLTAAANNFSVQNTGGYPCLFTSSNAPIHTLTPLAWTIEVAFQPEKGFHRTLVGRDSQGTAPVNTNLAALYLQITPADELAIVFCDVSGYLHMAISEPGLVQGFTYPYASTGQWQTAVTTCDGDTLRLYHQNIEAGGTFTLVAETDLRASGSPDRRLTAGAGSGSDWTHGTWSVGRGLYAGGHVDRAYGFIDEVRISQGALAPESFLFPPPTPVVTLLHRYSFNEAPGSTVEPDLTGNAAGTVLGTADYNDAGQLVLDGAAGSYIDLPNGIISGLQDATFEAWVTHNSTREWERILDFGTSLEGEDLSGTGDSYLFLTPRSSDTNTANAFRFAARPSITDEESPILNGPGPLPRGEEVHVVVSYNETLGVASLYTNGVLVSSRRVTIPLSAIDDRNNWLGRSQWNDPYFTGLFNEFRIYEGAMDGGQVAASYAAGPDTVIGPARLVVLNANDSGQGSLRQVVADANDGGRLAFTNTLSGQSIVLTNGEIFVTNSLSIDASSVPAGVIIHGNGSSRIFQFASGTTNTLIGLTLTKGVASGSGLAGSGGAILVNTNTMLTVVDSTLVGNSANSVGGGIANYGSLAIQTSAFTSNSAGVPGGGIYNDGSLTIDCSTFSGNFAILGGGIANDASLVIQCSTLSGNSAGLFGGGILGPGDFVALTNTVVAGNSPDNISGSFTGTDNLIGVDPKLAPLGNYGGPTQTMPPLPGSPAIDAGLDTGSLPATDQRGLARVVGGAVDIGAAEFQGAADVTLFWPTDWDGDDSPFGVELALGTDPLVADPWAPGYPLPYPPASGNGITFGFNAVATNYTAWVVKRSLDLSVPDSFVEIYRYDGPTGIITQTNDLTVNMIGNAIQIIDNTSPQPPAGFYQFVIEPSP